MRTIVDYSLITGPMLAAMYDLALLVADEYGSMTPAEEIVEALTGRGVGEAAAIDIAALAQLAATSGRDTA